MVHHSEMLWYQNDDDEEEDLIYSPALMARRASESWIDTPPVEVDGCSSGIFTFSCWVMCDEVDSVNRSWVNHEFDICTGCGRWKF